MRESCEAIEPLLAPYSEPESGVMSPDERARVDAHVAACEPCRRQAAICRATHAALRARAAELTTPAPALLAARCRAAAARATPPRRAARWAGWSAAGAAAAALVFFVLMPTHAVATQLAADHMKCATFAAQSAMTGTPRDLENAWLARRGRQVSIPGSSAPDGLQLRGLRRCVSTAGNMAHVMYDRHGSPVSLFIYNTTGEGVADTTELEIIGHQAILWTAGPNTYALVGRGQDLSATAASMQTQIERRKTED